MQGGSAAPNLNPPTSDLQVVMSALQQQLAMGGKLHDNPAYESPAEFNRLAPTGVGAPQPAKRRGMGSVQAPSKRRKTGG